MKPIFFLIGFSLALSMNAMASSKKCLAGAYETQETQETDIQCPIYKVHDEDHEFSGNIQSIFDGDEDYATLGINLNNKSVILGYTHWSYPEDQPDYKVSVRESGLSQFATIRGLEGIYKMSYDGRTGCIKLNKTFRDPVNGRNSVGKLIAIGRCTKNSDNYDYDKLKMSDLNECGRQPNLGN